MTLDQFVSVLKEWVKTNKQGGEGITAETELLGSGLLDSFDFLDLIMHIEGKTGRKIDLAAADPNDFSSPRGLYRLATGGEATESVPLDEHKTGVVPNSIPV